MARLELTNSFLSSLPTFDMCLYKMYDGNHYGGRDKVPILLGGSRGE
jgi:hypothetical protein